MKFEINKDHPCSLKCTPDLIEKEFGGIRDMTIHVPLNGLPTLRVSMVVPSAFEVDMGDMKRELRLLDGRTGEFKQVAKIIYADGTEYEYSISIDK